MNFDHRGIASMAEIVLISGIFLLLLAIGIVNFPRIQQSSSLNATLETFLSNLKDQQIKAMTGYTDGGTSADQYGIHFDTTSYTLFRGTYPTGSFTVNLPPTINITTQMKIFGSEDTQIVFMKGTGELAGCCTVANTITLVDTSTNISKTITFNEFGVITGIN